ncbi:MAG: peptidylprolyl isomerase [Gammaproteobacteria bacterium]|jgi:hypothetical protein|nr:peptidylprolyl isomerase [Gammaproteobacteria bacterium]
MQVEKHVSREWSGLIGSLIREPLVHFILIGAGLFWLFGAVSGDMRDAPTEIIVNEDSIATIKAGFEQTWRREPTAEELEQLIEGWVRDEILYREGLALNLQTDDPVVRRRVIQKFSFLLEGMVPDEPAEPDLEQWFADNIDAYRRDDTYSFRQIYFDPAVHGTRLSDVIASARRSLADPTAEPPGDPTLLPDYVGSAPAGGIAREFGGAFAAALAELPEGQWAGPIDSAYGVHLVLIESRVPAPLPSLNDVRSKVEYDLMQARAAATSASIVEELRARYTIRYSNAVALDALTDE